MEGLGRFTVVKSLDSASLFGGLGLSVEGLYKGPIGMLVQPGCLWGGVYWILVIGVSGMPSMLWTWVLRMLNPKP